MNNKLILSVLACGLAITSVYAWVGGPYQSRGIPPVPEGTMAGRFTVHSATVGEKQMTVRLDTATGRTWILERSPVEGRDAAGRPIEYIRWKDCVESDQLGLPDENGAASKAADTQPAHSP